MNLDPSTQKFVSDLAASNSPPLYTLTPEQAREVLLKAQSIPVSLPDADVEERKLPVGPKGSVRTLLFRPKGSKERLPVVMFIHGAGWVMGDARTHERLVRELVKGANVAAVFVDYGRSPENQFPTAIEEAYAATKYVAEHPDEFNVDARRMALVGDSVGGNMATVVGMLAKERGGPPIRFQALFYPVTDANFDNGSYQEFAEGPWLTRKAMKWFWDAYQPEASKRADPHVSPLRASLDQLKGLPPALVITDENDVLRDEGEAYAAKLSEAGVNVTQVRFLGTHHDFVMLNALAQTPAARGAIELTTTKLREWLHGN
uniref:Putative lipase n=1 Tax=Myxococcus virescens TaxID=83456 RepID=A0A7D5SIM1_9BACT|nr:putative lipase [Myxococcus virescens]